MKRRLVILGSSLTALAVARDAHAHGLAPVVIDVAEGIAFASRRARHVLLPDAGSAVPELQRLAGADVALIATGDDWLRFVVANRMLLDAAFGQVLHPGNHILDILLDKLAFAQWCQANELPTPRTWVPHGAVPHGAEALAPGLPFPLLLRPRATRHAHADVPKAVEVSNPAELHAWLGRYRAAGADPLLSESLLAHRLTQYSVPFARRGHELVSFVTRKLRPTAERCAEGTLVEVTENPDVEALARRAVERADYFGIGEAEILHSHDNGRSYLIEINARPWLQYALAPAAGHDVLAFVLGLDAPARAPRGRTWINLRGDRAAAFDRSAGLVRLGQLGISAYLRSLARSDVFAVFDAGDPLPVLNIVLRDRLRRALRAAVRTMIRTGHA